MDDVGTGATDPDRRVTERPIRWYARPAVDQFVATAAAERARLVAAIEDARRRVAGATATVGMHETMVSMLRDSQRELSALRRGAEEHAAAIMAEADAEATLILGHARPTARPDEHSGSDDEPREHPTESVVDLVDDAPRDEFLEFLRGALFDDEPLGPRPEHHLR
jgi:cell division septum initiation protein DivIVA